MPCGIPSKDVFRRSHDAARELGALHLVTACAGEYGLALGQEVCAEKSNEITAISELLEKIDVRGGVVTIDAMGAQKAIAEEVIRGKADHVSSLKGNHESLHRAVIDRIDERLEGDLEGAEELTTTDRGHGRQEERTYLQLPAPQGQAGTAVVADLPRIPRALPDRHLRHPFAVCYT